MFTTRSRLDLKFVSTDPLSKKIIALDQVGYEPTSYPRTSGVNITTNEAGHREAIQGLAASKAPTNSCHIGVSGWFNLDVIAARQSSRGIIFDSNPDVSLFFDHTFQCIMDSTDRQTFIKRMKDRVSLYDETDIVQADFMKHAFVIAPNILFPDENEPSLEINRHAQTPGSWLEKDSSYNFIRNLVGRNKIVVLTQDMMHQEAFTIIRRLLDDNGISIDTLYLSNVHDYVSSKEQDFLKTFALLSDDNTLLIDSFTHDDGRRLVQQIVCCRDLKSSSDKQYSHFFSEKPALTSEKGFFTTPQATKKQNMLEHCLMGLMMTLPILAIIVMMAYGSTNWQQSEFSPQARL